MNLVITFSQLLKQLVAQTTNLTCAKAKSQQHKKIIYIHRERISIVVLFGTELIRFTENKLKILYTINK